MNGDCETFARPSAVSHLYISHDLQRYFSGFFVEVLEGEQFLGQPAAMTAACLFEKIITMFPNKGNETRIFFTIVSCLFKWINQSR